MVLAVVSVLTWCRTFCQQALSHLKTLIREMTNLCSNNDLNLEGSMKNIFRNISSKYPRKFPGKHPRLSPTSLL